MSTFITREDYLPHIRDARLTQLIDSDEDLLANVEDTAIAVVKDALYSRYDVDSIFEATGEDRPAQVVRWVVCLASYYLHERLPGALIPERVMDRYKETLETLNAIADAKRSTNLPLLTAPEGRTVTSKFRWGSRTPRDHDAY